MNHAHTLFNKRIERARRILDGGRQPADPRQLRRCLRILTLTDAYVHREDPINNARLYRKAISRTY